MRALIEERERALDQMRTVLSSLERFSSTLSPDELRDFEINLDGDGEVSRSLDAATPKRQRGLIPPRDVAIAVRNILMNTKRPMKRGELVAELEKIGFPLSGKDKNKNLGTILWRHKDEFIQIDNLGYWLKDVPLPGVYEPSDEPE